MKGLKRNLIDKFYTKPQVVQQCIDFLIQNLSTDSITEIETIIEPSAGAGAFIEPIRATFPNKIHVFYDIEPDHPNITQQDFLTSTPIHNSLVLGNPPFGRKLATANKFIKHATKFARIIAFILPKSFKKQSVQKTAFSSNFHLVGELDLPYESFLVDDEPHDVPCVFQIWVKKDTIREIPQRQIPIGFKFVKQGSTEDEIHLAFRRIGVNAGKVWDQDFDSKSNQSHYFIELNDPQIKDQIFQRLNDYRYPFDNTVGPKSISKQELTPILNQIIHEILDNT